MLNLYQTAPKMSVLHYARNSTAGGHPRFRVSGSPRIGVETRNKRKRNWKRTGDFRFLLRNIGNALETKLLNDWKRSRCLVSFVFLISRVGN
jgi:hypothetical protein